MQRRNFLSSVFAALIAAKTVNAEERKLSPEVSEESKTKFDENTLLDTIKNDPAFPTIQICSFQEAAQKD